MKKLYIFDCYGVVINEIGNIWAKNHNISGEKYKKWRKIADKGDLGKIDEIDVNKLASEISKQNNEELSKEWMEIAGVNLDVIETIRKLHCQGAGVVMLSNTDKRIHAFLDKLGVSDIFDEKFLSYELGMKKPELEVFQYVLDKMNAKTKDTCFIDDNEINLRAAEKLGIKSVLYPSKEFSEIIK